MSGGEYLEKSLDLSKYLVHSALTIINEDMLKYIRPVGPEYGGQPSKLPWSGWYWPQCSKPTLYDLGGPLEKYDKYVSKVTGAQSNAVQREKKFHADCSNPQSGWFGHCNGISAAAIREKEPASPITKKGVMFDVGDQKGLMSEAYFYCSAIVNKKIDTEPHVFHKILLDYVGKSKKSVMVEKSPGTPVWWFPVAKYEMSYEKDMADPAKTHVTCRIWFSDVLSDPDFVGTVAKPIEVYPSPYGMKYFYWISGDISNPTDGGWEKGSVYDHPDYVVYPGIPVNPPHPSIVDLSQVGAILSP